VSPGSAVLAHAAVDPFLRGRFGKPYLWEQECESTQLLLLDSGLPEGAVAAADFQTAGRGRRGHQWVSPPGSSVLASVMLHPPAGRHWPELSLVGGVAAAEAVEGATDLSTQLKWPNDVMLDRSKVGGVIAEARDGTVVLGIGINVNQARDELPLDSPTKPASLRTVSGREHNPAAILGSLLFRLERLYDTWRHGGLRDIYTEIGSRHFLFGRRVRVAEGEGTAGVIAHDGRLEVLLGHGNVVLVESGELELIGA
jgi:BirA family biotin operon repressor/biotin-[acetyl-CoA-carboxylase] ligase